MMSLGRCSQRQRADLVEVDDLGVGAHVVRDHVVRAPGVVDAEPVREMAAVGELHGHHRVARLEQREQGGEVGGRARVRLHVGVLGAEDLLAAVDGELLDLVDDVAAAVVARARRALGVLVGEHRAGRLEHGAAGEVLAGDELERLLLTDELAAQQLVELRVEVVERLPAPLAADGAQADSSSSRSATRRSCRPPSKGVVEPDLGDGPGLVLAEHAAAEAEHVAVVVAPRHLGEVRREAVGGAHARDGGWPTCRCRDRCRRRADRARPRPTPPSRRPCGRRPGSPPRPPRSRCRRRSTSCPSERRRRTTACLRANPPWSAPAAIFMTSSFWSGRRTGAREADRGARSCGARRPSRGLGYRPSIVSVRAPRGPSGRRPLTSASGQ